MENEHKKSVRAESEEKILRFWEEQNIFEKTVENTVGAKEFVFYEGPPTANGKPGIHHLEARAFKDAIPRYKTMRGFHVRRKGGWDTHGLPVELQVEKALGLNSKKAIEEYGIEKFNEQCKESVWTYLDIWNKFTTRIGYWVDQKNPYVTYHNSYIESVWNVFKKIHAHDLVYKDYRIVPWCPRCGTALSSHELAQGYQDDKDLSVTAKFKLKAGQKIGDYEVGDNTFILAWTTTPWTLPGNVALAVGGDIDYVVVEVPNVVETGVSILLPGIYVMAKEKCSSLIPTIHGILLDMKGSELVGLEYEPLYPYMQDLLPESQKENLAKAFKVYAADFVTTTDGTGVVHTAVMYGQDDFELGTKLGLPKFHLVNLDGTFIQGTGNFAGRFVKDEEVAVDVIKDLAHRGLLFKKEKYEHSYPHCWRCKTPLIYYARDSWYIRMSDSAIKEKLIEENKLINWEPAYTRDGRFGEWLKDLKDWAISRERYWGTPLPIWQTDPSTSSGQADKKETVVVDSIETLKKFTKKSGNKYFVMRHGGTEGNEQGIVSYKNQAEDNLTALGQEQVAKSAEALKEKKIDLIISSPFTRTRETTAIVQKTLGLSDDQVVFSDDLQEINAGDFDGKQWNDYHKYIYGIENEWFTHRIPNGESLNDVRVRIARCLYDLEKKYAGKNILMVTHGGPAWLMFVNSGEYTPEGKQYKTADTHVFVPEFKRFDNAEFRELAFVPLPHNDAFELDLHRPYIDTVELVTENGEPLKRVSEVMDVWFDSGAMPFAQDHYPFLRQAQDKSTPQEVLYPADFISEAIDQTRGWFYTLHAIGILMGKGRAYNNVICLGHILDAQGKKMSKSLGNIVDPWEMMDKYGVDTLRLWMYSVNQPGESKNFDEKTVAELHNKVFNLLYNVLAFYELYRDVSVETEHKELDNVLDRWILTRLNQLIESSTTHLDNYKLLEPVREMREFIDDLSTWYVRRSRERIKEGDTDAKRTLYVVLKTVAKLMAPFAPFAAEDIWQKLKTESDPESVHLTTWPRTHDMGAALKVLSAMENVRMIVTKGLELRQKAGIKIRQPLQSLSFEAIELDAYHDIIKDELNVKEILSGDFALDTTISPELKKEGDYRELVRALQDLRKKEGLQPSDRVTFKVAANDVGKELMTVSDLAKEIGANEFVFEANDGAEIAFDDYSFTVTIVR